MKLAFNLCFEAWIKLAFIHLWSFSCSWNTSYKAVNCYKQSHGKGVQKSLWLCRAYCYKSNAGFVSMNLLANWNDFLFLWYFIILQHHPKILSQGVFIAWMLLFHSWRPCVLGAVLTYNYLLVSVAIYCRAKSLLHSDIYWGSYIYVRFS